MSMCLAAAGFLAVASLAKSTEISCAGGSCLAENGTALLQSRSHRSKNLHRPIGLSKRRFGHVSCLDATMRNVPPPNADGYKLVKDRCCFQAMSEFIAEVAVHMGFIVCGSGFAPGLAVWHGCDGDGATRTFADLESAINDHSGKRCTALGQGTCVDRPSDCPDYSGVPKPARCDCSQSKSQDLVFSKTGVTQNNLGNQGPIDTDDEEIRYSRIGSNAQGDFDLVVEVEEGNYDISDAGVKFNGVFQDTPADDTHTDIFGKLFLNYGTKVVLRFSFEHTDTKLPAVLENLAFTVYDLDGDLNPGGFHEAVHAADFAGYITESDSHIVVDQDTAHATVFANKHSNINAETVRHAMDLTTTQRRTSVVFLYKSVSSFLMTYELAGGNGNVDASKYAAMMFGGKSALIDHCGP